MMHFVEAFKKIDITNMKRFVLEIISQTLATVIQKKKMA